MTTKLRSAYFSVLFVVAILFVLIPPKSSFSNRDNALVDLSINSYLVSYNGNEAVIETVVNNLGPSWSMPAVRWNVFGNIDDIVEVTSPCPGSYTKNGNTLAWVPYNSRNCVVSALSNQVYQIKVTSPGSFLIQSKTDTYYPVEASDPDFSNNEYNFSVPR